MHRLLNSTREQYTPEGWSAVGKSQTVTDSLGAGPGRPSSASIRNQSSLEIIQAASNTARAFCRQHGRPTWPAMLPCSPGSGAGGHWDFGGPGAGGGGGGEVNTGSGLSQHCNGPPHIMPTALQAIRYVWRVTSVAWDLVRTPRSSVLIWCVTLFIIFNITWAMDQNLAFLVCEYYCL